MADFVENSAGDEDEKAEKEQYFMESPAASADFFDWSLDFSAENAKQSSPKEDEEPAPEPSPPRSSSQKKRAGAAGVSSSLPLRWAATRRSLRIRRSPPVVAGPPLPPPCSSPPPARASTRPKLTVRKSTGAVSSTTLRIAPAPASSPSPRRKLTLRKPASSPAVRIPAVAARKEAIGPSAAPSALSPGRSSSASGASSPGKLLPEFYVNRKPWTKREDEALRNYAAGNKKNWKKIASLLNKWERPYEDCIVRFYTVIRPAGGQGRRATARGDEEEEELNQENRVAKISADVCEIKKSIIELRAEMNVIGEKVDKILSTIYNKK